MKLNYFLKRLNVVWWGFVLFTIKITKVMSIFKIGIPFLYWGNTWKSYNKKEYRGLYWNKRNGTNEKEMFYLWGWGIFQENKKFIHK